MHLLTYPSILLTLGVAVSSVSGAAIHQHHVHHRALTCNEDNTLRALERFSKDAAVFCPKFLTTPTERIPSKFVGVPVSKLSSACTCFQKTASPANPVPIPATSTTSAPVIAPTSTTTSSVKASSQSIPIPSTPTSAAGPTGISTSGRAYGGGKRGLVYDYKSKDFSKFFQNSRKIAFGSNWGLKRSPAPGVTFDQGPFVPTIRVDGGLNNNDWIEGVRALIGSGTPMIFASNEPDNRGQSNLTPSQAATVYKKYIQPFKGQASLSAPAVTNGGGATGLGFLENFVGQCSDCHFDIINVHHYVNRQDVGVDQAVSAVKSFLTKDVAAFKAKHPQFRNARICLGEFWLWGASDEDGAAYLRQLLPWLDGNNDVAYYQAFGGLWEGNFVNNAGTGLSRSGQVYYDL